MFYIESSTYTLTINRWSHCLLPVPIQRFHLQVTQFTISHVPEKALVTVDALRGAQLPLSEKSTHLWSIVIDNLPDFETCLQQILKRQEEDEVCQCIAGMDCPLTNNGKHCSNRTNLLCSSTANNPKWSADEGKLTCHSSCNEDGNPGSWNGFTPVEGLHTLCGDFFSYSIEIVHLKAESFRGSDPSF